jgi:hypothetical protein
MEEVTGLSIGWRWGLRCEQTTAPSFRPISDGVPLVRRNWLIPKSLIRYDPGKTVKARGCARYLCWELVRMIPNRRIVNQSLGNDPTRDFFFFVDISVLPEHTVKEIGDGILELGIESDEIIAAEVHKRCPHRRFVTF